MIGIVDFSRCPLSSRNLQYGGRAGEKRGIIYNENLWFLKFPKNTIGMRNVDGLSYVTSPLNEYIGSHIYEILGYDVHKTLLGICFDGKKNKIVCACKDFINDEFNEVLIPYTSLRNDTNPILMERKDSSFQSASNINEILFQLKHNSILKDIQYAQERFLEVAIVDMLINNNDRNEDNWGVIKFKKENKYILSPIYDCGNCFYGKTSEDRIDEILNNDDKLFSSAMNGVTAYEDDNGSRISAINILKIINQYNRDSILKVYNNFISHYDEIESLILEIPNEFNGIYVMSSQRKEY